MLNSGRKSHCFLYYFQNTLNFIIVHLDCCCSVTKLYLTPCDPVTAAHQAPLLFTISWNLLKFMSIASVILSNYLILCRLLLLPSIFPSFGVLSNDQFFISGGQSIGASALASVLPMNIQGWFPLGLTGVISLLSKTLSRVFSNTTIRKHQFFWHSVFLMVQPLHLYLTTGKTVTWTIWTFVSKVISLLFNMLSRFVIASLPRTKCLLISWLQLPSVVTIHSDFGAQENKIYHCFHFPPPLK